MNIPNTVPITPELIAAHGLKPDEFQRILDDVEVRTQPTRPGAVAATVKGIATVNRFIQVRDASTPKLGT